MTSVHVSMLTKVGEVEDDAENGTSSPDLKVATAPKSRSILLGIIIAVMGVLLFVTTLLFVVFAALYATGDDSSSEVCQSEACLDLSVQIKGAMDESVNPCEDFYNFTCGNWPFFNKIPPGPEANSLC